MSETKPKKMVRRSVAISLGIISILLIAVIAYFSITGISAQNSYNNLQKQNNQLQTWLDGNETLLNQTETWLADNITYYNSQITNLQNQNNQLQAWLDGNITYYNSQISSLNSQIADLQNQLNVFTDKVLLVTSMGNITIELYDDMPITTGNFKNLVRTGVYNGTLFSRVAYGFVIEGGDATPKGITVPPIRDELPNKHSNVRGAVAMAKTSQPNSATSIFFIDLNDTNAVNLDSNYSVFGMVISGMDVVDAIGQVPIIPVNSATDGTPVTPVTIISAQFIS